MLSKANRKTVQNREHNVSATMFPWVRKHKTSIEKLFPGLPRNFSERITVPLWYSGSLSFFRFYSILSKTKNKIKKISFVSIPVRIRQNNGRFAKDCFVMTRIVKIF